MLPRRLHIGNEWNSRRKFIEVCEVQRHANSFGDGNQVKDEIGGTSYGCVDHDGILKGFSGKDLVHSQVFFDHLHDAHAG
jgi:hypothetical protein